MTEGRLDSGSYRFELAQRKFGYMPVCSEAFSFGLHKGESEGFSITRSALLGLQNQEKHDTWLYCHYVGRTIILKKFSHHGCSGYVFILH